MRIVVVLLVVLLAGCSAGNHPVAEESLPFKMPPLPTGDTVRVTADGEEIEGEGRLWAMSVSAGESGVPIAVIHGEELYHGWPAEGLDGAISYQGGNVGLHDSVEPLLPEAGKRISWIRSKPGPWEARGTVYAFVSDYAAGRWRLQRVEPGTDGSIRIDIHPDWQPHSPSGWIWFGVVVYGSESYAAVCDGYDYGVEDIN